MLQLDWNATKEALRVSMPVLQFKNWLKPVQLIRLNERTVVLGVPSHFHEQWIRSHYSEKLQGAIKGQCGSDLQLEFEIIAQQNAEAAEEPAEVESDFATTLRPRLHIVESEEDSESAEVDADDDGATVQPNLPIFSRPFFESEYNRVAYRYAEMFAKSDHCQFNPLIIFGGVGMGKTHLLTHIGQLIQSHHPRVRVRYTNFDLFSVEYVDAVRFHDNNTALANFRRKYRYHTDVLLFDDLQGMASRKKSQEELVHVFNEITARGGRIVFTSSMVPHRIDGLSEPLKSRICAGVIGEIKYPAYEERVGLLNDVARHESITVDPLVIRTLAGQGQRDVRELLGLLVRVHTWSQVNERPVDHQFLAEEGLISETRKETVSLDEIISLVEHHLGTPRSVLASKSRKESANWARQVAMYLARQYTLLPLEEIGKAFGRDHATVFHGCQKVTEKIKDYPGQRYEVEFLEQRLRKRGAGFTPPPASSPSPPASMPIPLPFEP